MREGGIPARIIEDVILLVFPERGLRVLQRSEGALDGSSIAALALPEAKLFQLAIAGASVVASGAGGVSALPLQDTTSQCFQMASH